MKIQGKHIYLYGKYYDTSKNKSTFINSEYDIMIYKFLDNENRTIGSLEGFFISEIDSFKSFENNPLVLRNQMKEFEEMYKGKFFPFTESN